MLDGLQRRGRGTNVHGQAGTGRKKRTSKFIRFVNHRHREKIKYIFETHFHADFVSGHIELAQKTGAIIIYGPSADPHFKAHIAKDGEEFKVGDLKIKTIHTPGHTLESTCFLLHNEQDEPYCIFTGDTLFVGDVGRPDLFSGNLTKEELASIMYDSLQQKIKPLADSIILYPAHGPGSSCGKNLGPETFSTIGVQKATNYALQDMSREAFIKVVCTGLVAPPAYFPLNAKINKDGYENLDSIYEKGLLPLTIKEFKNKADAGAWIIDTRAATVFTHGFVPDAISIGLDGRFAEWAGTIIPLKQALILVTELGKEKETITRLARVGIDNIQGYLDGGFELWKNSGEKIDLIIDIEPDELAMDLPFDDHLEVLDVRKEGEFEAGHIKGAINMPVQTLMDPLNIAMLDENDNIYIHCAGGYRSVIAASIIKKHGFHNLRNVLGGFAQIKTLKNIPIVSGVKNKVE